MVLARSRFVLFDRIKLAVSISTMANVRNAKLSELTPDPGNANKGTERGAYMVRQSLQKLGAGRSVLIDKNGVLIAGNKTTEAAYEIGLEDVIVVPTDGTKLVVVQRTDLDLAKDAKAKELAIADNRASELGLEWDAEVLQEVHDAIGLEDWFTEDEVAAWSMEGGEWEQPSEEEDEEATADLIDEAEGGEIDCRFQVGDIIALGRHRIACGDSTDEDNVRSLLGDKLAVLVHADPPYGMGKEKDGVLNDNLYRDKLDVFQMAWWNACRPSLESNASAYIWGNAEDLWRLWYVGGLKASERLSFRNEVIWDKQHGQGMKSEDFRMYPTTTERCLFFMLGEQGFNNNADNYWNGWESIRIYLKGERDRMNWDNATCKQVAGHSTKSGCHWFDASQWMMPTEETYKAWQQAAAGDAFKREYDDLKREYDDLKREWYATRAYFDNAHDSMTDVWDYARVQGEDRWGHATPKPLDMISRIYKSSSPDNGFIYSPFLGSGTDVIAAERMEGDRTVYGFELSPHYIEVICRRYEKFTGETAKLVGHL